MWAVKTFFSASCLFALCHSEIGTKDGDTAADEFRTTFKNWENEYKILNESLIDVKNSLKILSDQLQRSGQPKNYDVRSKFTAVAAHRIHDDNLNCLGDCSRPSSSCDEAMKRFGTKNYAYPINIPNSELPTFYAFCYYSFRRYTIIQRRHDGSENFYRSMEEYRNGFGHVFGEYWLGLDRIHEITKQGRHELWIWMKDFDGNENNAYYSHFEVASRDQFYKLTVSGYSGNAGDSFSKANGQFFQAYDSSYPMNWLNCPEVQVGAWWYPGCPGRCNLNGPYQSYANRDSYMTTVYWYDWRKYQSLRYVHMAIVQVDDN